jgi:transcriptional regulator with XRE-family HTH domain
MSSDFAPKLNFVLKVLSMSRAGLASELGVDKSAVGRWATGAATPSAHNLAQLTSFIGRKVEGFNSLDWDRDLDGLAAALGLTRRDSQAAGAVTTESLPLSLLEQGRLNSRLRASAYEGLFRSTRPYAQVPGGFVHDCVMIRAEPSGHLGFRMASGGVSVEGWVLLLQNQLFCVGGELTSGSLVFAILNGVSTVQAGLLDGLILFCALDPGRTPTATAAVYERIADLSGDRAADEARFMAFAAEPMMAPEDTVPEALRAHLVRDIGPEQLASGGDWLLRSPLVRTLARGLIDAP